MTAVHPVPVGTQRQPRSLRGVDPAGGPRRIRVGIIGATGYVGAELVRLLARHPDVDLVGLQGRDRDDDPIAGIHPHLATTGLTVHSTLPPVDAVFLALPHGTAAALVPDLVAAGTDRHRPRARLPPARSGRLPALVRLRAPATRISSSEPSTACPSSTARSSRRSPTPTSPSSGSPAATRPRRSSSLAPLARAGLIGDLVVDAKSGVSGAGREAKPELMFGEVNESVKAYGLGGHRHVAEIEQELAAVAARAGLDPSANPGAVAVDFLPHLIPMTRGILSACHVRPTRPVTQAELDELYAEAYADEPFVTVVAGAAGDEARDRAATRSGSTSGSTSGSGGSSPSASRTTSSRAPPDRPSRPSTSSTACPRRPACEQLPLAP